MRRLISRALLILAAWGVGVNSTAQAQSAMKKTAIVFGGNCDEGSVHKDLYGRLTAQDSYAPKNKFLNEMSEVGGRLTQAGWDTKVLYDSTFARCAIPFSDPRCQMRDSPKSCCEKGIDPEQWNLKAIENAGVPAGNIDFGSKKSLLASLNRTADSIALEGAGVNHEVLLLIDTHGEVAEKGKQHGVCLSDGSTLYLDDPELVSVLQKLKKNTRGKLAVMDDSCFGGGTIPVLSKALGNDTCVLSSQSAADPSTFGKGLNNYLSAALKQPGKSVNATSVFTDAVRGNFQIADGMNFHQPLMAGYSDFDDLIARTQAASYRDDYVDQTVCKADPTGIAALTQVYDDLKKVAPETTCYDVSVRMKRVAHSFEFEQTVAKPLEDILSKPATKISIDFRSDPELAKALPLLAKAFGNLQADPKLFALTPTGYQETLSYADLLNYGRGGELNREYELIAAELHKLGVPNYDSLIGKLRTLQHKGLEHQKAVLKNSENAGYAAAEDAQLKLDDEASVVENLRKDADDARIKLNHCLTDLRLKDIAKKADSGVFKACDDFKFN